MSKTDRTLDWYRLTVEGIVIVVSILLAFSIDAWWDRYTEQRDAEDQAARVVGELRANIAILQEQDAALGNATSGAREFLSIMGPEARDVPVETIGERIYQIYGVPTLSLSSGATRNLLSSGQLTEGQWVDIRLALTELLSEIQQAENASLELRQMRPEMLEHMRPYVSGLAVVKMNPTMEKYPRSQFESDPGALLSDMSFESLVAYYTIRMEINRDFVTSLLNDHNAVLALIEGQR